MSGVTTVLVAIISAAGAGLVYLWQKAEDRRERFRSEKQAVCKDYLRSMRNIVSCAIEAHVMQNAETSKAFTNAMREHDKTVDLFEIYASQLARETAVELESNLSSYAYGLALNNRDDVETNRKEYLRLRSKLVSQIRQELFGNIEKSPGSAFIAWIKAPFVSSPK